MAYGRSYSYPRANYSRASYPRKYRSYNRWPSKASTPRSAAPYSKRPVAGVVKKSYRPRTAPVKYQLTKPMRSLVDARVNKHLETTTIRASGWDPSHLNFYTLRPAITNLSVFTIIPRIAQATTLDEAVEANTPYRKGIAICPKYCKVRLRLFIEQNSNNYDIDTISNPTFS